MACLITTLGFGEALPQSTARALQFLLLARAAPVLAAMVREGAGLEGTMLEGTALAATVREGAVLEGTALVAMVREGAGLEGTVLAVGVLAALEEVGL